MSLTTRRYFASRYPNARLVVMLVCLIPFLAGTIGTWLVPQSIPYGRLVCLWISFSYTATWTLSMSVATANTAGHTKKVATNAMLLIGRSHHSMKTRDKQTYRYIQATV